MTKVKINRELLLRIAENARLNLTEKEVKKFLPELQEILNAFSKIDKAEVDSIEASFQPIKLTNVTRCDRREKCLTQEQALSNTEHKEKGYFKGPRVV